MHYTDIAWLVLADDKAHRKPISHQEISKWVRQNNSVTGNASELYNSAFPDQVIDSGEQYSNHSIDTLSFSAILLCMLVF
jgi:hypothetical protein